MSNTALSQRTTITASTAETTIVSADPNFRTQLTGLVITTTIALPGTLTLRDSVGGAIRLVIDYPNASIIPGSPFVWSFNPPLSPSLNSNSAWTLQASAKQTHTTVSQPFRRHNHEYSNRKDPHLTDDARGDITKCGEINGGAPGGLTQIRRVISCDMVDGFAISQPAGLKIALAEYDSAAVQGLVGFNPVAAQLNRTYAFQFTVPAADALTVNSLAVVLTKAFRITTKWGVAVYNSTGTTKLLSAESLDATTPGLVTVAQSAVAIGAGTYWLGISIPPGADALYDTGSSVVRGIPGAYHAVQRILSETITAFNYGQASPRQIIGNASVNGVLPSSLGVLTLPQSANDGVCPPWIFLQ
jgi:hypothetical protein